MKSKIRRSKGPTSKRYSEAFKRAVVTEIGLGRMTRREAERRYGIRGGMTIRGWLSRYATARGMKRRGEIRGQVTRLPTQDRTEREVRELKAALAHVTMERVLLESLVQEASERLGVDIKKDFGLRR